MSLKVYQEESIRKRDILETSRDYLQSVIDNIGDLTLVIDTKFRVVLSNTKLNNAINAIDPAQKGLLCHNLSHLGKNSCKDKEQPCPMKKVLKTKSPVSLTRMYIDDSGNRKFFDVVAAPLFGASGEIIHLIESCRDVTDRVKTEQTLLHSEERYRSLFEQSNDAICIFQPEGADKGKILSANRAASIMHGYTNKELLNLSITDLMYSEETAGFFPDIKSSSISDSLSHEVIHRKKSGEFFPVEASTSFITAGEKKIVLAIYRDISSRKEAEEYKNRFIRKLELMSKTDGLTGLFNRQHIDKRLQEEMHRARRYNHPLSLIMLDIDNFKTINDSYGHISGDKILQKTAAIVNEIVRDSDVAGRFGGDEFIIILTETGIPVGIQVAERIMSKISRQMVPAKNDQNIRFSVSVGIAEYSNTIQTPEEFIGIADNALYAAKNSEEKRVFY
jgi:diguanylate cyclase (GGDEF)-like protein/PAS domain S-box-containing protein